MTIWRKLLLSSGAALGTAAVYNAYARRGVPPLQNLIGGDEHFMQWRGHRLAYTVRGEGPPLLLVHSIHAAGWSFEWRRNVDVLARTNTVYALDLPGFGRSDRPAIRYTAQLYQNAIGDFARQVIGTPVALVATSLSGAYAIALAASDPTRYPAVVAICPTGLTRLDHSPGPGSEASRFFIDAPVLGTAAFNALVSRASLTTFLRLTYNNDRLVTPALIDVHYATSHQPGARHAPAAFVARALDLDIRASLRRLTQPLLVIWGAQADSVPVEHSRAFRIAKPDCEVAVIDRAGDLPHDEGAEEFNELVAGFLSHALHEETVGV